MLYMAVKLFSSWLYWTNILLLTGAQSRGLRKSTNTVNNKGGTSSSPFSALMMRTFYPSLRLSSDGEIRTFFGYRYFLRVFQRFCAAVNVSVNMVPPRPVLPCWPPALRQLPVQGYLEGSWRRELSGLCKWVEGKVMGRACTAGSLRTLNPLQWPQTPFSIKRQGGKGRGAGKKGKDKLLYYPKNVTRKKWNLIKSCN